MHTSLTQWRQSGLTMPLCRHSVGTYLETSTHATHQGTLGHSHLSSLSHCGHSGWKSGIVCGTLSPLKKKKCRRGMNGQTFSQTPRTWGRSHIKLLATRLCGGTLSYACRKFGLLSSRSEWRFVSAHTFCNRTWDNSESSKSRVLCKMFGSFLPHQGQTEGSNPVCLFIPHILNHVCDFGCQTWYVGVLAQAQYCLVSVKTSIVGQVVHWCDRQ